ncbi:MAG: hypothetical protein Q9217_001384 [Psora testacea]
MTLIWDMQSRPGTTTPNAAAQLAASQAFLANRASNANLSAFAAAAALRSHTGSPTPVGQIQTKRMQRRGSITSNGSAPARPGGLQRRDSSGSMTERTFRERSPSRPERPASSHGPYSRYDKDAPPPVPTLPQRYTSPPPLPQISSHRPASVEPPERISSPSPRVQGDRGVSLDRGPGASRKMRVTKQKFSSLDTVGEANQAVNRASINFSRPMSPQNMSPRASPTSGERVLSPPPQFNATTGVHVDDAENITKSLYDTAARPVKKKKKAVNKIPAEDSHLTTSNSGVHQQGAAVSGISHQQPRSDLMTSSRAIVGPKAEGSTALAPPKTRKKKKVLKIMDPQTQEGNEGFGNAYPSDTDSVASDVSSTTDRPRNYNTRAAGILAKQPSVVREDREGEEKAERKPFGSDADSQVSLNGTPSKGTPANTSKIVSNDRQHNRSVSETDAPRTKRPPSLDIPGATRPTSLSSARAAHFLAQPMFETPEGVKHQPPSRSVSPAKSALKNSPSRGHSPVVNRTRALAPSEASDTASAISDDGSNFGKKKKKSVRVSFDEDSVMIGRAASPASTDSPVILSPQSKPKPRSWLDLVRDKRNVPDEPDQDQEDSIIKPTPTLPSFGSVRGRNDTLGSRKAEEVAVDGIGADKVLLSSIGSSSDQAVGQIIRQDAASKGGEVSLPQAQRPPEDPLPTEITFVESSSYHPDQGDVAKRMKPSSAPVPPEDARMPPAESAATDADILEEAKASQPQTVNPTGSVPSIAVMPATPGAEESLAARDEWLEMPGGFPGTAEEPRSQEHVSATSDSDSESSNPQTAAAEYSPRAQSPSIPPSPIITPATVGIAEPEPEAVAAQHDANSPHVGEVADTLRTQIEFQNGEESEDHNSIYSDAAEDQNDVEGDGFGSINAIVESPVTPNFGAAGKSPPASPALEATEVVSRRQKPERKLSDISEPASDEGWDRAQAYWSGLSQTQRQQLEQAALPGALDEPIPSDRTIKGEDSVGKKKKKAKNKSPLAGQTDAPLPPWPDQQYRNGVARSPPPQVRSSAPALQSPQQSATLEPHLRISMRGGKPLKPTLESTAQRRSVQTPPPDRKGTLQKKTRQVSAAPMVDYNKSQAAPEPNGARPVSAKVPAAHLKPTRSPAKKPINTKKPKLDSIKSNGSDSDSSFKRMRSSTVDAGRYHMKRTMRGGSGGGDTGSSVPATSANSTSAQRTSAVDPPARRSFSSIGPGGGGMRTTMRDSRDTSRPARMSLRNSMDPSKVGRTKSPSHFGFSLGSKAKPIESKPVSKPVSGYGSRFGDSSDDGDVLPTMSSSRFVDSSDDDEPALAPVRGIPRRTEEGDSTDLDDSSAENVQGPTSGKSNGTIPPSTGAPSTKPEGFALASGSQHATSGESAPAGGMGATIQAKKAAEKEKKKRYFFGALGSRRKDDLSRAPKHEIESPAHHDTPVEQNNAEPTLGGSYLKSDEHIVGPRSTPDPASPTGVVVSQASTAPSTPKSPKLQRRNTPKQFRTANGTSWPLPQSPGGSTISTSNGRPRTSDGTGANSSGARPDIGSRRVTAQSAVLPNSTTSQATGGNGKKKRFPMLRKALGFHN